MALARLLAAAEALGAWGKAVGLVLIVLLPKLDGGLRPIGFFPTIVRLWMRARTVQARAWEAAHAMPQLFGGAGIGAQRAAWTVAFRAEAAALGESPGGDIFIHGTNRPFRGQDDWT